MPYIGTKVQDKQEDEETERKDRGDAVSGGI